MCIRDRYGSGRNNPYNGGLDRDVRHIQAADNFSGEQHMELDQQECKEDILRGSCMRNQGLAKSYFSAELCLCRLVQDVCVSLVDAVDFDVDFLNESGR